MDRLSEIDAAEVIQKWWRAHLDCRRDADYDPFNLDCPDRVPGCVCGRFGIDRLSEVEAAEIIQEQWRAHLNYRKLHTWRDAGYNSSDELELSFQLNAPSSVVVDDGQTLDHVIDAVERIQMEWRVHRAKVHLRDCERTLAHVKALYEQRMESARAGMIILSAWREFRYRRGYVLKRVLCTAVNRVYALISKL